MTIETDEEKEIKRIKSIINTLNKVLEKNLKKAERANDPIEINALKHVLNIIKLGWRK